MSSFYAASEGYLFTVQPSTLRTHLNSVARLLETGELGDPAKGTGKKIGILSRGRLPAGRQRHAAAGCLSQGRSHRHPRHAQLDQHAERPGAARGRGQRHVPAGVKVVFLNTNALFGAQFVNDIESRPGCRPAYVMSDFDFQMSGDSFLQQMPDGFYRRAIAVTVQPGRRGPRRSARAGLRRGLPRDVREAHRRAAGPQRDRRPSPTSRRCGTAPWSTCSPGGSPPPGRTPPGPHFAAALGRIGAVDNAGFGPSCFAAGRTDAPTHVRRRAGVPRLHLLEGARRLRARGVPLVLVARRPRRRRPGRALLRAARRGPGAWSSGCPGCSTSRTARPAGSPRPCSRCWCWTRACRSRWRCCSPALLGAPWPPAIELLVVRRLAAAPPVLLLVATVGVSQLLLAVQFLLPAVPSGVRAFPPAAGPGARARPGAARRPTRLGAGAGPGRRRGRRAARDPHPARPAAAGHRGQPRGGRAGRRAHPPRSPPGCGRCRAGSPPSRSCCSTG